MPKKQKVPPPPPLPSSAPAGNYLAKEDSLNDLLQDIHRDNNQPQDQQNVHVTQKRLRDIVHNDEVEVDEDENLGENFEQTPWVPPSVAKAKEFRRKAIYRGGDARIDSIEIVRASDLGAGVTLYFQFALSMAVCLFIMSLLSLPALIFAYNGQNLSADDQDSFGLFRYTLGNIGYDAADYPNDFLCSKLGVVGTTYGQNETCIQLGVRTIPMSQAASVVTAMEFLQIAVFFIGVFHLYRTALSVTGRTSKADASVTDYTVMVTDLPRDVTDVDLVDHFSSLYRLDGRDFRHRPGVESAQPVRELHNSGGNELFLGTWVAECVLHKGIGAFISDFKNKAHVMDKMYRARATMKMYAENSPHKDGHNLALFQRAEKAVHETGALIDAITQKNLQQAGLKLLSDRDRDPEAGKMHHQNQQQRAVSDPKSIYYNLDAPPVAAFVVFEHAESFARCLRDHAQYAHYPMRWFYPNVLKIKGHKVSVSRASEPDQILWENLEVTQRQKTYLRIRTSLITLLLVIGCFIVVLQASIYKTVFADRVPDNSVCADAVPQLFANASSASQTDLSLARPAAANQRALDAQCKAVTGRSDAFYAVYAWGGDLARPATDRYDFAACVLDPDNADALLVHSYEAGGVRYSATGGRTDALCPEPRRGRYCPCVSTSARASCATRPCFFSAAENNNGNCESFSARSIGACYCYQQLAELVSGMGVVDTLSKIESLKSGECGGFYSQYSLSVGLTYVAVLATTVVNVLLRAFLKRLAKHEARSNTDEEQGSVMTKIFLSNYATMAVIILVAYGKAARLPAALKTLHIFAGVYADFSPGWYGQVGYFLVTTSILQSYSPLAANLLMHYVGQPLQRWFHHSRVRALKSHSIVMQHDLNMLEVGPVFDSTDHTAQLLTLLFFAMTFAPGLPLLMPLCCLAFALYFRVDKLLLCRYYQAPPHVGDATIRLVVHLLPFAAIVRLGFACWMFSCPDTAFGRGAIAAASASQTYRASLDQARASASSSSSSFAFANSRVFQPHTFPLFLLLLVVAAVVLVLRVYAELPLHLLLSRLLDCVNSLSADGHASEDARRLAEVERQQQQQQQQQHQRHGGRGRKQNKLKRRDDDDDDDEDDGDDDDEDDEERNGHQKQKQHKQKQKQDKHEQHLVHEDLVSAWSLAKLNDPLRQQSAGYTQEYFRFVKHRDEIPDSCYEMLAYAHLTRLSDLDKEQGWRLEERGEYVVRTKVFLDMERRIDGSRARVGQRKRTFEVVGDNKCFSYDIEKVPAYATAMRGLREGTASLQDFKHLPGAGSGAAIGTGAGATGEAAKANAMVYDEADLANHAFSHYHHERPSSAHHQNHQNQQHQQHQQHQQQSHGADGVNGVNGGVLDAPVAPHSRNKPQPLVTTAATDARPNTRTSGRQVAVDSNNNNNNNNNNNSNNSSPQHPQARPGTSTGITANTNTGNFNARPGTSTATANTARPGTSVGNAANTARPGTSVGNTGNFTFDDFDNMDFGSAAGHTH